MLLLIFVVIRLVFLFKVRWWCVVFGFLEWVFILLSLFLVSFLILFKVIFVLFRSSFMRLILVCSLKRMMN